MAERIPGIGGGVGVGGGEVDAGEDGEDGEEGEEGGTGGGEVVVSFAVLFLFL